MATTTSALELIAVEVRADLDQLTAGMGGAVRVVDQSMGQIDRSVRSTEKAIVVSAGNINQAMARTGGSSRALGQQFSQLGQQVVAGASPLQALAIQLPDIAFAMEGVGGKAAGLARFLGGPWGVALTLAASAVIPLIDRLFDLGDTAEDQVPKVDSLTGALDRLRAAQGKATAAEIGAGRVRLAQLEGNLRTLDAQITEAEKRAPAVGAAGNEFTRAYVGKEIDKLKAERAKVENLIDGANLTIRAAEIAVRNQQRIDAASTAQTPRVQGSGSGGRPGKSEPVKIPAEFEIKPINLPDIIDLDAMNKGLVAEADQWFAYKERLRELDIDNQKMAENEMAQLRESRIVSLAGLYETAFRGGTGAIWRDFENIGLRVIARVLAQFTMAQFGGGGGFNLGSAIGTAFSAVLGFPIGFAGGGSFTVGGRGGTDRNTLSLNGRPIANVSRGETVSVTGGLNAKGAASPTIVNQTFVLDARYGITTPELLAYINQTAEREGQRAYQGAVRDTPRVMAKRQRFGGV